MTPELIQILNASASISPEIMTAASHRLNLLSAENPSVLYAAIAEAVFSTNEIGLTTEGRLIGVIYLKNMIFDSREWHDVNTMSRNSVRDHLFNFIFTGANIHALINEREQIPGFGVYIPELVARYVKNEWLRESWDDCFWDKLVECCAWSCLRSSLKTAATFRLPSRRRAFLGIVSKIFPKITELWCMQISHFSPGNLICCDQLTRLLVRCVLSWGDKLDDEVDNSAQKLIDTLCSSFKALLSSIVLCGPKEKSLKFIRHLAKLLFVSVITVSPSSRSSRVNYVLELVFYFLNEYPREPVVLDRPAIRWILALLCGFMCSRSQFKFLLSETGLEQLQNWLSQPSSNQFNHQGTHLTCLLELIINKFFIVEASEIENIVLHPEECLTAGGFCGSTEKEGSTNALSLWNPEIHAREALNSDLRTITVLAKHDNPIVSGNSCRQLSELLVILLAGSYRDDAKLILYNLIQSNFSRPETAMRLAQLCLPYFGLDPDYKSLIERLLENFIPIANNLLESFKSPNSQFDPNSIFGVTRFLCLLTRHATYCFQSDHCEFKTGDSKIHYKTALDCLNRFLARPCGWDPKQHPTDLSKSQLSIRLAAATSLAWFVDQHTFPNSTLVSYLEQLIFGMLALMQDVCECETRIYLLKILRDLVEAAESILYPEINQSLLNVLDQLWQLDDPSPVLKSNILDLICLVLTNLNYSPESWNELADFTSSLQVPIATLIHLSLTDPSNSISYALFEPALRLWASMVEGEGSRWSPALENLVPMLSNTEQLNDSHSTNPKASLVSRLDSAEQADLVFRIAQGTLRLANQAGPQILDTFLSQCTEPFWASVLMASSDIASTGNRNHQITEQTNLECLYSQASRLDTDNGSDEESKYRLNQLNLFTIWLSIYLDRLMASPNHDSPTLTPSLIGLLILATKYVLQAPLDSHNDISPRATQYRLGFLARLAIYPAMWPLLLQVINFLKSLSTTQYPTTTNLQSIGSDLLSSASSSFPSDSNTIQTLIEPVVDRWLARADSALEAVDRRCLAIASLISLRHMCPNRCLSMTQPRNETELGQLAVSDQTHAKWFEPIINLIVQVLHENDPDPSVDLNDNFYRSFPQDLASMAKLKNRIMVELNNWQTHVGGPLVAEALLKCHVDPALRNQLEHQLNLH